MFFGYAFDKLDGKTEITEMKYEKQVYSGSKIREKSGSFMIVM